MALSRGRALPIALGLALNGREKAFSMLRTAAVFVGIGMLGDLVCLLDMTRS